jgi:hypothetical protein
VACALNSEGVEITVGSAVIDNACTTTILGKNAIPYIRRRWTVPPATVYTANGVSQVHEKGSVMTVYGLMTGYIVEESDFSLWALEEALKMSVNGEYHQTLHDAYIEFANGNVINFEKEGKLWIIELYDNDYVPFDDDLIDGKISENETAIEALATSVRENSKSMHGIQGHSVHDPKCEHCLMGRMRTRAKRRVSGPRKDQRAGTIYIDLMGPFECDVLNNVYEMTVVDSKCGWIEVVGIKDKSCETTDSHLDSVMTELTNNCNTVKTDYSRVHSDQGNEFKGVFDKSLSTLNYTHTDTGGYNSEANPAENAQGRLQQTARAMLAAATGGHDYFIELRGPALKRAAYCINRKQREESQRQNGVPHSSR